MDAIHIRSYYVLASRFLNWELENLDVVNAWKKVLNSTKKTNIVSFINVLDSDETKLKKAIESGYRLIFYFLVAAFLNRPAINPIQSKT